ncbi:17602_t:CDS:2, partial [Racocetra fulgida]
NESELPLWETCLADFYGSSEFIVNHRSLPRLDRVVAEKILKAKELPETKELIEDLRIPYERAYDGKYGKSIYKAGEKAGLASSERKNRHRTLSNTEPIQRKAIGKKGDAYIRTIGSTSTDWGASEAGHKWEGTSGTKLIKELGLTLPRTLKDILIHLAGKIHFAEEKLRKLNIVGFAHADPLEVYADANNFSKSLDVLIEIICGKMETTGKVREFGCFYNNTRRSSITEEMENGTGSE